VNGWLSLPLTLPRRVIDEGGSLVDAVLELPALLRSLGESLATMDEQVRGAASAVANIEDELQGVLRSVEPLDTRLQAVIEAVEPLEDEIGAVRAHVDPLSGQLDALERRLGSLEGHMDAMAGSITELHGDLRKIPGIWSPEGGTTVTDTIADLTARVDFQATGDPALSDAADSTEVSLLGYGELYSLWERQQWSVQDLDFTQDRIDWQERIDSEERTQRMYGLSSFFIGERTLGSTPEETRDFAVRALTRRLRAIGLVHAAA
jgi:chromosome segregation ATPase